MNTDLFSKQFHRAWVEWDLNSPLERYNVMCSDTDDLLGLYIAGGEL